MLRKKLKVEAGKTYTVRDAAATYTIIVGDLSESDSAPASPTASDSSFAVGVGAPSLNLGRSGGVYLDSVSRKIYTKDATGWDAGFDMGGSSSGLNGSNGRTTLEGSGPTTDSVVYAAALSDAGITASDVQNGDLYLDTLNHVFYKRVSGAWVSRSSHKGQRGRTIFEGSGDPDDPTSELPSDISDAAEGDLYHDVANFRWHRRNSSGVPGDRWTARSVYLGSIGPIGPNGLNGSNGLGGLNGSNGSDGRTTIEGAGPPTNATVYAAALADAGIEASGVKNGDLYLDTLNHVFYKRTSGAWVSRTSHTGRNGKTIFDGSGDPDDPSSEVSSDIGDAGAGDLYHDVTNFKWYKRNSSGSPGDRWDPRNSYKPSELKNVSLTDSVNLAELSQSAWSANAILAAAKENDTVVDSNNKRMYKRTSTGWEDQGSIAGGKGDKGDGGDNGQDGRDGVSAQLTNDSDIISTDSDGSGYDFTDTGGEFEIRTGGAKVSSGVTYYAGTSGASTTSTVNGLTLTINSSGVYSLSGASWTRNFARFTIRADYGGVTYTKVYKLTKALAGLVGSNGQNGLNGSSGADGKNGTDGIPGSAGKDGVSSQLTNDSDVIPTNSDGAGFDFTDTGGEFEIRSGGAKITSGVTYYVGAAGTSSTSTVNGLTLSINSSGAYSLSGSSWTQNFARFTMRAIYDSITYTKVYKLTKARAGLQGSNGLNGSNGSNGADGTNGKKVAASSAISLSGSPVGATSYGCEVGDTLIDTINHKVYTRASSSTWTLNGSSFKGTTGESSLIGQLTKEVAVIPANSSGAVTNANLSALGGGYFKVYNGKTDVTSACTFIISSATAELAGSDYIDYIDNLQLNLVKATGQFSLSGETWSADSTSFTMQATYGGSAVTKIYNVTKSKTGPGIKVYSVALGADSATSDIQLTASYKDMYLADVITNEGNVLTAVASKSATTFTINESGRYKIELQAAFRIKNITKSSTYSAICSAQIVKSFTPPYATWTGSTSTLQATLGGVGTAAYSSSAVTISKTAFLASGTTLKVQAKTSNMSGGSSYLELADDAEVQSTEDTILTITKL